LTKNTLIEYLEPIHSVGYLARINFRAFSKALEKLIEPHGVSAGQWRVLRVLWEHDGVTQRELCRKVGITEATGVKGIASLAAAGFVKRTIDTRDKRKIIITLTPHARTLEAKLIPMVVEVNERALEGITKKEADIVRRVLAKTYFNLTKEN
tara:strand:+ start:1532 stop:1987 length:456 start_codon:yes stop_codon:yes gene_type:complete